jgi:hypothetical protein
MKSPIVVKNFISEQHAKVLLNEINSPSEQNPYPEYYKTRFGGTAYPYNKTVLKIQRKYSLKANEMLQNFYPEETKKIKTYKCFGSKYFVGNMAGPHIDDQFPEEFIEYSTIIYLNDNFEGGVLYFPHQNFEYIPEKYSAVFFISDGQYWEHGVTKINSGSRSTLLYMHTTQTEHPNNFVIVDPDLN